MNGNNELLLFHCISSYPAPVKDTNLLNIKALKKEFEVLVGLSDHTTTNLASTIAVSLGAVAIEKHFKLTNSVIAEQILNNWDQEILHFVKIMPKALKEVLAAKNKLLLQAS